MITTHVLDTATGRPAAGMSVILEVRYGTEWTPVARGTTDARGRLDTLTHGHPLVAGTYRLTFDTRSYDRARGLDGFFPEVQIAFEVRDPAEPYHVPLLLSPFGFSAYRGV